MTDGLIPIDGTPVLTDSGLETDLIFGRGWELPEFASFPLLDTEDGRAALTTYYQDHVNVALTHGTGFVFEAPTWRASQDWGNRLGYDSDDLRRINADAIALLRQVRDANPQLRSAMISGNLGPRADGYSSAQGMTAAEACSYHRRQIESLSDAGADVVTVLTLSYAAEALGIVLAARETGIKVIVSFTVETDGSLADGSMLGSAIELIDEQSDGYVSFYGLNCAHPGHMKPALTSGANWTHRIGAVRANASKLSHAELDALGTIDPGDPLELAAEHTALRTLLPNLTVFGGCCGTDVRHVDAIADAVAPI
jgi:homocysteine S-methyltransferase